MAPTPRTKTRRASAQDIRDRAGSPGVDASPSPDAPSAGGNERVSIRELPLPVIASVVVVVVVAVIAIATLSSSCSSGRASVEEGGYVSPYSWENLAQDERGRLAYSEDGQPASQIGIDVSDHQGSIDWNAVAADGIDFAFVRVGWRGYTEGALNVDEYAAENLDGASAAGLDVGAYFFSQATTPDEAREEAEFVLSIVAGRYLAYPIVFDHEPVAEADGRANNLDDATVSACAQAFCERIEEGGYSTMIYGNTADMARIDPSVTATRPVWFAEYGVDHPTAQFDFSIWQYDNEGSVAGISTTVDMNILFETAPVTVQ